MRHRLFAPSVLTLASFLAILTVSCGQTPAAPPAATQTPAKPTAAAAAAPATAAPAAPTKAPAAPTTAPAAAWVPDKNVEFVVHSSAGGGSDIQARTMENVIREEKLYPKAIAVTNRTGGSGAVAFSYVASKKSDPYYWVTAATSFFTTPARGQVPVNYKDFTMLAKLSNDIQFVLVRADSPYKTMKELLEAAKAKPSALKWAGTSVGADDHIFMSRIEKASGTKINFISTTGGGEVMTNLLGGHVEVCSANPGEALAQIEAKKVRILGSSGTKKMEKYPDVLPLVDQGINATYLQVRMIGAPGGIPVEARRYYEQLFRKMADSKGWQKYLEDNDQQGDFMIGSELDKFTQEHNDALAANMNELGLIEKK